MRTAPRFTLPLAAVALCLIPAAAGAGLIEDLEKAELETTGNDSELVKAVPIATAPGVKERTVMSLGPEQLRRVEAGDRLRVGAEVQVSTTCVEQGPRCIGRHYDFAPRVYTRVVLAAGQEPGDPAIGLSATEEIKCTQRRPNRNHHCTIALQNVETAINDLASLPCAANECYVNVILGAYHRRARKGNVVVLGADRPDASVKQDKGRLNVVHSRAGVSAPTEASSNFLINPDLPLTEGKKVKRRVVFTVELPPGRKGDVLAIDGSYVADINRLPFNVFLSSRLIVTESPTATESTGIAKRSTILRGEASEANGFNCTQGRSGYASPCTVKKTGAIRITRDVVDETGLPAPLYVSLVSSAKALLTAKVKQRQRVQLSSLGGLRVTRWTP